MHRITIALIALAALGAAFTLPRAARAQYDSLDAGAGYHVTWHGWSEDGWVHWQNDCYAGGCTGWYVVSAGP